MVQDTVRNPILNSNTFFKKGKTVVLALLSLLFLTVILPACSGVEQGKEGDLPIDYNQYAQGNGFFCCTDTAFLFYEPQKPIQFVDSNLTQPPEVMCAKPNCRHNSADCSGYIDATGLFAYDNQLYYVAKGADSKVGLYQMDFGGGNRKELFSINEINELQSYGFTYRVASGYFLLDLQKEDAFEAVDTLYLYPLKEKETVPVAIYEEVSGEELVRFWIRDDWVLYTIARDSAAEQQVLYGYQISTQQTTLLCDDWRFKNELTLRGDQLYFFKETGALCVLDLVSMEEKEFPNQLEPIGENYNAIYDDAFFYLTSGDNTNSFGQAGVFIYTYQGELLQFIPFEGNEILVYCISGPDVTLFYDVMSGENAPVYYLEKADIAKGQAKFLDVGKS